MNPLHLSPTRLLLPRFAALALLSAQASWLQTAAPAAAASATVGSPAELAPYEPSWLAPTTKRPELRAALLAQVAEPRR